jgi:hypothetical protein
MERVFSVKQEDIHRGSDIAHDFLTQSVLKLAEFKPAK